MDKTRISFLPFRENDIEQLYIWLNTKHVNERWGNKPVSPAEVNAKYLPLAKGTEPSVGFFIMYDSKPIGFIQTYRIDDYPEYKRQFSIKENAAGLDLFIGEVDFIGKGLGAEIIKKFTEQIVFKRYDVESCIVDPAVDNYVSVNAFKRAGFEPVREVVDPDTGVKEILMRLKKI